MSADLKAYFNKQPRLVTLSTADREGRVNAAYFGSPFMTDERTITVGLTRNRTLANLRENPRAVFLIMEPGRSLPDWRGVRVYVRMTDCATEGEALAATRSRIAQHAGEAAARAIQAAVTFTVEEIRPLADFGQGWEKSIG